MSRNAWGGMCTYIIGLRFVVRNQQPLPLGDPGPVIIDSVKTADRDIMYSSCCVTKNE